MTASAGISHMVVSTQGPWKVSSYCPSRFSSWYSGKRNLSSQSMNSGENICRLP